MNASVTRQLRDLRSILPAVLAVLGLASCGLGMDSGARLERGQAAYAAGEYRAAAIDARSVLQTEPDNAAGRLLLGRSALQNGDVASAEKELRRAVALGVRQSDVASDLGQALLRQRKFQEVMDTVEPALAAGDSPSIELHRLLGNASMGLGHSEQARRHFQSVLAEDSQDVDAMLAIVSTYRAENELDSARATLDEVRASHADYIPVWLASAAVHMAAGSAVSAEADYRRAVDLSRTQKDPASEIAAMQGLTEVQLARNDLDGAQSTLQELGKIAADDGGTRFLLGRLAYARGDWSAAQSELQTVLQQAPDFMPAQTLLGAVHLKRGNLEQANMYLSAVVGAIPGNANARRLLAETRLLQNQARGASEILQPLLDGNTTDGRSLVMAARAKLASGDYSEAVDMLRERLAADPTNESLQLDLAAAYLAAGDTDAAERILQVAPGGTEAGKYRRELILVMARVRDGDYATALTTLAAVMEEHPKDVRLHDLRGGILLASGQADAAKAQFLDVLALSPGDKLATMSLGHIEAQQENFPAARERYLSILAADAGDTAAMVAVAKVAAMQNNLAEMREWLEKARASNSANFESRVLLARLDLAEKKFAAGEAVIGEALQLNPDNADLYAMQGTAQFGRGLPAAAVASFEKALALAPGNPGYKLAYAQGQLATGNKARAMKALQGIAVDGAADVETGAQVALIYLSAGNSGEAMKIATDLRDGYPQSEVPHIVFARIYLASEEPGKALASYDAALDRRLSLPLAQAAFQARLDLHAENPTAPLQRFLDAEPHNVPARLIVAQYEQQAGDIHDAIRMYEELSAEQPSDFTVLNNLAWAYFTTGDSRAENIARKGYRIAPDNGSVVDTLGWILVRKGSYDDGVEFLRKAVQLTDGRAAVQYHLAVGLVGAGNKSEARLLLKSLVAENAAFDDRQEAETLLGSL